ncbi:zinc finger protein DZIP1 [Leptopilina heterotoma]|uniref:zinc finger protein DZIP1 n=1 Tax=Leptopilina heterotoma TaxID=63436 RepID=UPI001CA95E59|nr:zinc finger protein DZIP1 [Leptopilina heterotoma]
MTLSFRMETHWCHDFPKLAKESGFYFTTNRSKIQVDWNKLGSIDVDRVIRERDFVTVDETISNIIDYSVDHEYAVNNFDPNFIKLFRLAQLATEYLLYCKQYLDKSVVILKEELRKKIQENYVLQRNVTVAEEQERILKDKLKERNNKIEEAKTTYLHNEIFKCPHCTKTFISAMFVRAHISRRHQTSSDSFFTPLSVHEEYRIETEKLHNEIKTLKEKLNQTEKLIRSNSSKVSQDISMSDSLESGEKHLIADIQISKTQEYQKRYQTQLQNLKSSLFREFEVTSDLEISQDKLQKQDSYCNEKLKHLENNLRADIEDLCTQLKLKQKLTESIKSENDSKTNIPENQSNSEKSAIVVNKNVELKDVAVSTDLQVHSDSENLTIIKLSTKADSSKNNTQQFQNDKFSLQLQDFESSSNSELNEPKVKKDLSRKVNKIKVASGHEIIPVESRNSPLNFSSNEKQRTRNSFFKETDAVDSKKTEKFAQQKSISNLKTLQTQSLQRLLNSNIRKNDNLESVKKSCEDYSETEKSEYSSESESSESSSETESSDESQMTNRTVKSESEYDTFKKNEIKSSTFENSYLNDINKCALDLDELKSKLHSNLNNQLRKLGIDPEWNGIPSATYKEKFEILKHHQKIKCKKFKAYSQIQENLLDNVYQIIYKTNGQTEKKESVKKSLLNKVITNVKSKAMKALSIQKTPSFDKIRRGTRMSLPKSMDLSKKNSPKQLDILPSKLIEFENKDFRKSEIKKYETQDKNPKSKFLYSARKLSNSEPALKEIKDTTDDFQELESSCESIESLPIKGNKELSSSKPRFELTSTSTSSMRSRKSLMPDFFSTTTNKESTNSLTKSPKNNRSVLKTASSVGCLIKKKVLFDLRSSEKNSTPRESMTTPNTDDSDEDDSRTSSVISEEIQSLRQEKAKSMENVMVKRPQNDKSKEISKIVKEQVNVRMMPSISLEAISMAKSSLKPTVQKDVIPQSSLNTDNLITKGSFIESRKIPVASRTLEYNKPSSFKIDDEMLNTEEVDLDVDISELLEIE